MHLPTRAVLEDHLTWKLASLKRNDGLNGARLIEALDDAEIETILWGYPDASTEPMVLFAMLTMSGNAFDDPQHEKLSDWVSTCATWLCLEWLKRRGAVADYSIREEGASWDGDVLRLTSVILDDLATSHPALHRFATYALQRTVAAIEVGNPAHN